jgi:tetratricopeptide (TPR) repeat protein
MPIKYPTLRPLIVRLAFYVALACVALSASGCGDLISSRATASLPSPKIPAAAPLAGDDKASEEMVRFLEGRVKSDPEDFVANNKLAAFYLQRARETGSLNYLDLATRAAKASLASVPVIRNAGGLSALTQAEFSSHDFAAARDHAVQLTEIDPGEGYPYAMLGDALLELGDYDAAASAFQKLQRIDGGISDSSETRQARLAYLRGDNAGATRHFTTALVIELNRPVPPRETVAWCRWQLGETAFAGGDYETAEQRYREALVTFPDYYRALASLGRVRAAVGDLPGAIVQYERVVQILPDPTFVATLGDLYKLAGREKESAAQYALVEQIGHLSTASGALYNRQLALFYADHDMKADEAYADAAREYEARHDIYGADALAWTALKAGKISEAQAAINNALKLGTRDAKLFYHAGMIARAAGDKNAARDYIERALTLNPQFDPWQAVIARRALEN